MPSQSLARIMYGTSQEYSVAAVTTPLAPLTNLSNHQRSSSAQEPETIAQLLHKAWASLFPKH